MIPNITELNFPKIDGKQYASLTQATAKLDDMGEKTITTQVKIDGEIVPDFSHDWEIEFQGEKYIMPLRIPAGSKDNEKLKSTIDLTFQHWAIYQLKRWPFVTIQQIAAGTYLPDEEVATVQLNLKDFCILFGQVLEYYYGDTITIDLNPAWQYKQEATIITISHTKIWNVLIDAFHDKYGVRWEIKPTAENSNTVKGGERYVIRVGYPATEVDHIFEYGFEGGLLKVERQVQSEEIRNMLKGRGGETNIPFRYFKDTDPNNKDFRPDPDWVEELANIYFPNLMGATFRSYIQGWKAAHISKYPGYTAVGESNAYAPWAYRKGYTDTKFSPVEFVADEITINPATGDKQAEILPGYSPYVKKGSSLDKYGSLPDTLDNNEDIYPTLQGTGLDIAVAVEQIESDDVAESVESDAKVANVGAARATARDVAKTARQSITIRGANFTVPAGRTANFIDDTKILSVTEGHGERVKNVDISLNAELTDKSVNIYTAGGIKRAASGIPAGTYYYEIVAEVHNLTTDKTLNITVGTETPKLEWATIGEEGWKNTFNIWVKNIWDSTRLTGETDSQYSERVWKPVLGDRERNTAKVVFTSGALAVSEDYEFTVVDFPTPDTSKTWQEKNDSEVVIGTHTSYWRITLAKSEAELEATGLYVPSTQKQGKAGDRFVFIGTEMTHVPYVVDAEERLDDWKKDQLGEVKEIKPTAVVTTDRVRLNNEGKPNALINQLRVGNSLRLFDKRFFNEEGKAYETLYLQSITYTYREPTSDDAALNPDAEIVLGNEYTTSANPVTMMQGEISALQKQVGSISNVEQIVRAVGDKLYLRKDGISDRSLSPTQFFSLLTSGDFRAGLVGGAGWGFFKDENGNWVLEADRVNVRQEMQVNTLVINQAEGRGGMEIDTAAYVDGVTRVVETDSGYVCYFDQKEGTVANLFHVDDVAFCNRWTPENAQLKFYKRRVTAVGADSITLSKTDVNGTGIPAEGDNIIHFGNYTDATRQYVKVRDVVGGGYERYIEALNSVNAEGVEYYFIGKQAGESRWFVGNKDLVPYSGAGDGSYIEYINRKFNLNNVSLSVNTTIGDKTIEEYIKQVSPPVKQEDIEGFVNAIVDPKLEGIQNQIDGVIETWFYNGVPTLSNYPASSWNTPALKAQHLGDLYYDNNTGTAYRFSQDTDGSFYWNKITDEAITKALAAAQKAQDTADGKRRVFTAQPTPPYDKGDLWVNATYGTQYNNDILRCITSKATGGAFAIGDWTLASKYTDDTLAQTAIDRIAGYEYLKNALLPENPTQITGGLIMSTLISLGYTDEAGLRHTLAGMNGSWVDTLGGRTIASWYGGDMVDLFDAADGRITPLPANAAKSLLRMDGSAYFSGGNIGFRADGSGWLGNDTNGIKFGTDGSMVFGNGIKINLSSGEEGLAQTLESVVNLVNNLSTLLKPVDAQGNELQWSQAANAFALLSEVHFGSKGEMTAYVSGGLSGAAPATSLADLTDVELGSLMAGDTIKWDGQKWVNSQGGGGLDEDSLAAYLTANNYVTSAALGNYVTVDTEQTISGKKTFGVGKWAIAPFEVDDITDRTMDNGTWGDESGGLTSIRHGLDFRWYDTHWVIGNVRDASTGTNGFGIGLLNQDGRLDIGARITTGGIYSNAFRKVDGTSSQFLKADGSVDGTTYATIANLDKYLYNFGDNDFDPATYDGSYVGMTTKSGISGDWWHILSMGWGDTAVLNNKTWVSQLALPTCTNKGVYYRAGNGALAYGGWTKLVDASGDTMTGPLTVPLNGLIVGSDGGDTYAGRVLRAYADCSAGLYLNLGHDPSMGNCGEFSFSYAGAASASNSVSMGFYGGKNLTITYGGGISWNSNTIWHAGNDGSGSGLDADLLDGAHGSQYLLCNKYWDVNADNISNGVGFCYANGAPTYGPVVDFGCGSRFNLQFNAAYSTYHGETLHYRTKNGDTDTWNPWCQIARITDNVASATKLHTARTLYVTSYNSYRSGDGVAFDGTGDVTLKLPNSITASDWFRSYGASGWYNESYGGGIYMEDATWVRVFNGKSFYTGGGSMRTDLNFQRGGYAGSSWNSGYGALNVEIYNNDNQTPLLVAPRVGADYSTTGANRLFAMELLNNGAQLNFGFGGAAKFYFYSGGNFVAVGDSAAGSDIRLKSHIEPLANRGLLKPKRFMKNGQWCLGFIAQEVLPDYPELIRDMGGEYHMLSLCYGNVTAVLATQINELYDWREDQRKINENYDQRIKRLEERL